MNVIVISPDFPHINVHLCEKLAGAGLRVLGIGDAAYDNLDIRLRESLTEYFRVDNLDSYDAVYRGVAFFAHKYGKPAVIESNNPHWLALDGLLREDFNVDGPRSLAGTDNESLARIAQSGIPTNAVPSRVYSWEALIDDGGNVVVDGCTRWPSISRLDYSYRTCTVSDEMADLGRKVVSILGARSTFVHLQVSENKVVRASLTPAPAFTLDMLNFSQGLDIHAAYAHVLASQDPNLEPADLPDPVPGGICVYASRHADGRYRLSSGELEEKWKDKIVHVAANPDQYRGGMGDWFYMAVVESDEEADGFAQDVTDRVDE